MESIRFPFVMGKTVMTVTIAVISLILILTIGIIWMYFWMGSRTGWPNHYRIPSAIFLGLWSLICGGTILFCYLYAPNAVLINDQGITIERPFQPIVIPWGQIKTIRLVSPEEFKGTLRVFGNGGLFARTGRFHSPGLGNFRMYLTNEADAVLIEADDRWTISPANSKEFVTEALRAMSYKRFNLKKEFIGSRG